MSNFERILIIKGKKYKYICILYLQVLEDLLNTHVLPHPKGTIQRDFQTPVFVHDWNLPGPLTDGLKQF